MNNVDRLLNELTTLFNSEPTEEDLQRHARRYLSAFVGRVVQRGDAYAPLEEIMPVLQDARNAIHKMQVQGRASFTRIQLLTELDKAIESVRPRRFPPPKL